MLKLFKQLFCKHDYEVLEQKNEYYLCKCKKCGVQAVYNTATSNTFLYEGTGKAAFDAIGSISDFCRNNYKSFVIKEYSRAKVTEDYKLCATKVRCYEVNSVNPLDAYIAVFTRHSYVKEVSDDGLIVFQSPDACLKITFDPTDETIVI